MWIFSQKVSLKLCFIRELTMEWKANEICENVLYFFKKLRWNSHHIQLTILKCVIWWHSVRSWRHATIPSLWFQNFSITPKRTSPDLFSLDPTFLLPPSPGSLKSIFRLCGFAYSECVLHSQELLLFQSAWPQRTWRKRAWIWRERVPGTIQYLPVGASSFLPPELQPPSEHNRLPTSQEGRMMSI